MSAPNPYAPPSEATSARGGDRDASWALALGIASVFLCAPITAPIAIWRAVLALRTGTSARAIVGLALAVFGLLTSALFWFLAIWQLLSPSVPPVR